MKHSGRVPELSDSIKIVLFLSCFIFLYFVVLKEKYIHVRPAEDGWLMK